MGWVERGLKIWGLAGCRPERSLRARNATDRFRPVADVLQLHRAPDGYQPAVSVLLLEIQIVSESSLSIVDNVFADSPDMP